MEKLKDKQVRLAKELMNTVPVDAPMGLVYEAYKKGFEDAFNSIVGSCDLESHEFLDNVSDTDSREQYISNDRDKKIVQFIKQYTVRDYKQVYSNGTVYVPLFRVLDALIQDGEEYTCC